MSSLPPYTSAEFHTAIHKQLVDTAIAALSDTKLQWSQVVPFLDAGRAMCRDDVRLNGRLTLHGEEQGDTGMVEAEEAYLFLSVRDREDQIEWLSQSYWLSDIVLSDQDTERVRSVIAGVERRLARLKTWLADQEKAAEEAPDPIPPEADAPKPKGA